MPLIIVSIALTVIAQTDGSANLEQQVKSLSHELDADDKQSRVDAEKRLIEMGEDVLPLLPEIDNTTSAEVKDRLTRIRKTLEQQSAINSAKASRITAQGTMSLSKFFELVSAQTGNELVDYRNQFGQGQNELDVKLDFKDAPFFEVLDKVSDQVGLTVYNYGGELRKMMLVTKTPSQADRFGSGGYGGPFRFEATEVMARRDFRDRSTDSLRLRIELLWEPRILPIVVSLPYAAFTIKGEDGEEIPLSATEGTAEIPVQSMVTGVDLILAMNLPDRSVKKIASVRGKVIAMVPGKDVDFEFDSLQGARNIIKKRAGLTVTLDRVAKNRMIYEVRIKLRLDRASESLQSHLDWASNNVVYLLDKDGKKVDNPTYEQYLARDHEIGFAYLFPLEEDIADYKLIYKTPAAIIEMPVEFELKEIALP